jgi:hypothetical protein
MGSVTKAADIGAIRGTKEVGGETLETIEETTGGAVQRGSEVGADVTTAAVGAAEGQSRPATSAMLLHVVCAGLWKEPLEE